MYSFNNKAIKMRRIILLLMVFSISFSSLFAEVTASDILNKNAQRWDITFSDTDNGDVNNIETMLQEVNKVAKEIDKISVLLPRATLTGSCSGGVGCNLDSAQCDAITETPFCPDGSVLNTTRDMCQKDPDVFDCPAGFAYDTSVGQCVKPVECPYGGTYIVERQRCESPILYDCPPGYTEENGVCVSPPLCQAGATFNPINDMCEVEATNKCGGFEDGWIYDTTEDVCYKTPDCASGFVYNNTFNKCGKAFSPTCEDGYSYNSTRDRCEKNPVCPSGTTYNNSTDRCEQPNNSACSNGTWDGSRCLSSNQSDSKCFLLGYAGTVGDGYANGSINGGMYGIAGSFDANCNAKTNYYAPLNYVPVHQSRTKSGLTFQNIGHHDDNLKCLFTFGSGIMGWTTNKYVNKPNTNTDYYFVSKGSIMGQTTPPYYEHFWVTLKSDCSISKMRYKKSATSTDITKNINVQEGEEGGINPVSWGTIALYTAKVKVYAHASASTFSPSCPTNYTHNGSGKCYQNPTCPNGGLFDGNVDKCYKTFTKSCPSGAYDNTSDMCVLNANCDGGTLNTTKDRCEKSYEPQCANGWNWNSSVQTCEKDPSCVAGTTYSTTLNTCISNFSQSCASGYSYSSIRDRCEKTPTCSSGTTYNASLKKCQGTEYSNNLNVSGNDCWSSGVGCSSTAFAWNVPKSYPLANLINSHGKIYVYERGSYKGSLTSYSQVTQMHNQCDGYGFKTNTGINTGCFSGKCNRGTGFSFCWAKTCNLVKIVTSGGVGCGTGANACISYYCSNTNAISCPSGYTKTIVSGKAMCAKTYLENPTCPSGGQFDGNTDKCYLSYAKTCNIGVYDTSTDKCIIPADCFGGTLEINKDMCVQPRELLCSTGVKDSSTGKCIYDATCTDSGSLDATLSTCKDDKIPLSCVQKTDIALDVCYEKENVCKVSTSFINYNSLVYSDALKTCLVDENVVCASSLTWSEAIIKCEAVPICNYGVYNPQNNFCFADDYSCPINPSFECIGTQFNHWCSPWKCNSNNQCGYAFCSNNQTPKNTSPWMLRSLLGDVAYISNSQCIGANCDIVTNRDISYCGENSCPKGFGVYEQNNKCYQDVCPDGAFLGQDNNCYIEE